MMTTPAYGEGYNACYDNQLFGANPYSPASDEFGEWERGFCAADREIEQDNDCGDHDDGGWTREDEESMCRGRDLPLRNEAGEYMCG